MNDGVTADQVVAASKKKYWWKCPVAPDHVWDARPSHRTKVFRPTGCPCCSGNQASITNSLAALFPDVAAQLHPDMNDGVTADQIVAGSFKKYWWKCPVAPDHVWDAHPSNRTKVFRPSGCPCCSGNQASITNSLAALFPDVAAQLHPDMNEGVTPAQIVAGSNSKYWWLCPEGPDHVWDSTPHNRSSNDSGCPCCSGKKLSITNSLATLFPDVATQLYPDMNDGLTPDQIIAGSHSKYWWVCPEGPDHVWDATANSRTSAGTGCACCSGNQVSVTNSLAALFPDVAAELHPDMNDGVTADQILPGSDKKYWWVCPAAPDHIWPAITNQRTGDEDHRSGCPYCKLVPRSPQEIRLAFELRLFLDFHIDDHKVQSGNRIYDCDIIVREHRLIVEFDGSYYHVGRDERDSHKSNALRDAGWTVLRVRELPLLRLTPMDVSIPRDMIMKPAADAVLSKIRDELNIPIDSLDNYLLAEEPQNNKASERYIRKILKEASEKTRQPESDA